MTRVQEVEDYLAKLTAAERAEVLAGILQRWGIAHPGVTTTPGISGGDPCIVRTRIPVWLLESLRRQGATEPELLDAYPSLTPPDLLNAWAYVAGHRDDIERQIAEQDAA